MGYPRPLFLHPTCVCLIYPGSLLAQCFLTMEKLVGSNSLEEAATSQTNIAWGWCCWMLRLGPATVSKDVHLKDPVGMMEGSEIRRSEKHRFGCFLKPFEAPGISTNWLTTSTCEPDFWTINSMGFCWWIRINMSQLPCWMLALFFCCDRNKKNHVEKTRLLHEITSKDN